MNFESFLKCFQLLPQVFERLYLSSHHRESLKKARKQAQQQIELQNSQKGEFTRYDNFIKENINQPQLFILNQIDPEKFYDDITRPFKFQYIMDHVILNLTTNLRLTSFYIFCLLKFDNYHLSEKFISWCEKRLRSEIENYNACDRGELSTLKMHLEKNTLNPNFIYQYTHQIAQTIAYNKRNKNKHEIFANKIFEYELVFQLLTFKDLYMGRRDNDFPNVLLCKC